MKNRYDDEEKSNTKKKIMIIVLVIIALLSLITSCSCTGFLGKIGDLFRNEGNHTIDGEGEQRVIKNQDLTFDLESLTISLSDTKSKLGFSYKSIVPEGFTCTTSDADIATCYVDGNHIVINPKKEGLVTVTLETKTNGNIYQATAQITITESQKYISLDSTSGTINMAYAKTKTIAYNLIGLKGNVTVTSSDESVAKATVSNGVLKITALKTGRATITLSLTYDGKEYEVSYKLNVINKVNSQTDGEETAKDSDSSLKKLTINKGDLTFNPNTLTYRVGVNWWNGKVTLEAEPKSSKATLTYYYNGAQVSSLKNLKLNRGDNTVGITVTAEDGSTTVYNVIINKPPFKNNYLKSLTTDKGVLNPSFDKNTLDYEISVSKGETDITISAEKERKSSTITYTYNGNQVTSLRDLPLTKDENNLIITVTAESGEIRTYAVRIKLRDNDAGLKDLTISTGNLVFDPDTDTYRVGVSASIDKVSLSALANSSEAGITYTFNGSEIYSLDDLVLNDGDNTVTITVTAADGSQKTYTVIVNKALASDSNSLTSITTDKGTLTPAFDKDTLSYKINVTNDTKELSLNVIENNTNSKVTFTYNGLTCTDLTNLSLKEGQNIALVTVMAENGTKRVYEIVIDRAPSPTPKDSDSSLANLTADKGTLTPKFDSNTTNYTIGVNNQVDSIKIEASKSSATSKIEYTFGGETFTDSKSIPLTVGENTLKITVTAEDDSKTEYTVTINRDAAKSVGLSNITTNAGKLNPTFDTNTLNYGIKVDSKVDSIDLSALKVDSSADMTYKLNGNTIANLDDIPLGYGQNEITITVDNGEGQERTYTVVVDREFPSDNNYLSALTGVDNFKKTINDYSIYVDRDTNSVSFKETIEDSNSEVGYFLDGNEIGSLTDIPLTGNNHKVEIVVTAENGSKRTYTIDIKKSQPHITFISKSHDIDIENSTYSIGYKVTDDAGNEMDYKISEIEVEFTNFTGTIDKSQKGVIRLLNLDGKLAGTKTSMTISIGDSKDTADLSFTMKNYSVKPQKPSYEVTMSDGIPGERDIIIATDMFASSNITVSKVGNAFNICSTDSKRCMTVTNENSNIISLEYVSEKSNPTSLAFKATAKNAGTATIKVDADAFNKEIASFTIPITVTSEYTVTIDPNGGIFNEFSKDPLVNTYPSGTIIELANYSPYKVADANGCEIFELESWTSSDGKTYALDDKVTITSGLTLTAKYKTTKSEMPAPEEKIMYLADVELFHNEAYFQKYGEDKVIYPEAEGSYTMYFDNDSNSKITIKSIILTEETICPNGDGKCLNMGYILKGVNDTFLGELGSASNGNKPTFAVLNRQVANPSVTNEIEVPVHLEIDKKGTPNDGDRGSLALLWKWVGDDDATDTLVGTYVSGKLTNPNINDLYKLTVAIKYTTVNDACSNIQP